MGKAKKYNLYSMFLKLTVLLILFCVLPTFVSAASAVKEYNFTGDYQKFVAPSSGRYKLEAWGASGGYRSNSGCSGAGGYATGIIYLTKGDTLYIYVGGNGETNKGWNGGGYQPSQNNYGGGASDIRLIPGEWNNSNGLYSRLLVAGGGGTDGAGNKCGGAGGLTGGSTSGCGSGGVGATLTGAGSLRASFGTGGNGTSGSGGHAGAGGGGWYGGGGANPDSSGDDDRGGGGGSSFVWNTTTKSSVPAGYTVPEKYQMTDTNYTSGNRRGDGLVRITSVEGDGIESIVLNNGNIKIPYQYNVYEYNLTVDNNISSVTFNVQPKGGFALVQSNPNMVISGLTDENLITITDVASGNTQIYKVKINKQNYYLETGRTQVSYGYSYTGEYQLFYVPATGIYTLEAWGAQGGHRGNNNGGRGGYASAEMSLNKGEVLYIYVGGAGNTVTLDKKDKGFNGGGKIPGYYEAGGVWKNSTNVYGGGASDIRYGGDTLYNRVLVAGGGGSVGANNKAGAGAGLSASDGCGSGGTAGSYTAGGTYRASFGCGGNGLWASSGFGGAGGGGWYGGGGANPDGSGDDDKGGGGGSSFAFTAALAGNVPAGYLVTDKNYLSNSKLYNAATAFPSPSGTNETGHPGNGFVRISPKLINGVNNLTINDGEIPIDFEYTVYDYALAIPDTVDSIKVSLEPADGYSIVESHTGKKDIKGLKTYVYTVDVINDITGLTVTYTITFNKQSSYLMEGTTGSYGYSYNGLPQKFVAPAAGVYTIEAWGAQGGHRGNNNGGKGGYTTGQIFLNKGQILYVYVGSSGNNGGWNGGGYVSGTKIYGGGASDVRIGGTSLYNRILVAGGGGSVGASGNAGGAGGGTSGNGCTGSYGACATGGNQTAGGTGQIAGTFGKGGNGTSANGGNGGAGGGGWYGGGGSGVDGSGDDDRSGGGGSGYYWSEATSASAPSDYLVSDLYYLSEGKTIVGTSSMPSPKGGTQTGQAGNGFVKISFSLEFDYEIQVSDNVTLDNEFDFDIHTYNGTVNKNSSLVTFTVTDSEAILNVVGDGEQEIHVGDNKFDVAITYINGAIEVFSYNIPREANDIDYLNDIYFDDKSISEFSNVKFDKNTYTYNIELPYYMDEYDLTVNKGSADQIITNTGHIKNINNNYSIPISVTNETGTSTKVYTLNITKPHSSKIKKLHFTSNAGTKLEFDIPADETVVDIQIESYLAALYVDVDLYDAEAEATITGDGYILNDNYTITVHVKEPNVDDTEYTFNIHRVTINGYEKNLGYTGSVQKMIIPFSHEYQLEVWGAQGGNYGGNGGYSTGKIYLEKGTTLYIYAGGSGANGGFNGGGTSKSGYGGGASDIRIGNDSLYSRVIVAGGGGGHGSDGCAAGGAGGGISGGGKAGQGSCGTQAGGGTQTDGGTNGVYGSALGAIGTFGKGANAPTNGGYFGGGGGGGWYGGGSGSTAGWSNGGGGGSGFVYTEETADVIEGSPSWLLDSTYYLYEAETRMGNESIPKPTGGTSTGNPGNGYARVTVPYQKNENDFLDNITVRATDSYTDVSTVKTISPTFDREVRDYYVTLESSETKITLSARPGDSSETLLGTGTFDVPAGTTDFEITATAEAGNTKIYVVHVTRPADENPYPNDLSVSGLVPSLCALDDSYCRILNAAGELTTFNKDTHTYYITVPSRIKQLYFNVDLSHPNQVVNGEGKVTLEGGENAFTITILSEAATLKDESELVENVDYTVYNYIVVRDMTGNTDLEKLVILDPERDLSYDPDITEYYVSIPNEYKTWKLNDTEEAESYLCTEESDEDCEDEYVLQIYANPDDPLAVLNKNGPAEFEVGLNQVFLEVVAANGESKVYTLNVYREKNENVFLSDITVTNGETKYELTPEFNSYITGIYYVTVPNDIDNVDISATPEVDTTTVTGEGNYQLVTKNTNIIKIITTAQNGTVETYTIFITRTKNSNDYLGDIKVSSGDKEYSLTPEFDKDTLEYSVNVDIGTSELNIVGTPEVDTTNYYLVDGNSIKLGTNTKRIMVIAEDGSQRIYTLTVNRPPSDVNGLDSMKITNGGNELVPSYEDAYGDTVYGFDTDQLTYEMEVENEVNYVDVTALPIDINSVVTGTGRYYLSVGDNVVTVKVKSETNEVRTYTVNIRRKPNSNAYLRVITTSHGIIVPTFDKEHNEYIVNVEYEVNEIEIFATAEVSTTTISGLGKKTLNKGDNEFIITTTAQDGVTSLTYKVNVVRDKSNNENLKYLLMEEGALDRTFNPDIIIYHVTVPYEVTSGTIHAETEDETSTFEVSGNDNFEVGDNTVIITVTSEAGLTKDYKIIVTRQEQEESNNYLGNITISNGTLVPDYNKEQLYYEVVVPYEITRENVAVETEVDSATVTGAGNYVLSIGKNLIVIKVTGEDGKTRDYQIVVTREKNTDARIASLGINRVNLDPVFNKDTYEYSVTTTESKLDFKNIRLNDPEATYEIINNHLVTGIPNEVIIRVTAANGVTTKDYKFIVDKVVSENNYLASLTVDGYTVTPKFDKEQTLYEVEIPYEVNAINIDAVPEDDQARVTGIGVKHPVLGNNYYVIEVRSEKGSVMQYTLTVKKLVSTNNYASTIEVVNGTMSPDFDKTVTTYNVDVPYEEESLVLNVALESDASTYTVLNNQLEVGYNKVIVAVTAADGSIKNYVLNVTRHEIVSALLEDIEIKNYDLNPLFNSHIMNYTLLVDNETTSLDLKPITLDKKATYKVTGNSDFVVGNNTIEIEVTSSNGVDKETYTINVTRQSYANNFLDYLYTDQGDLTPRYSQKTMKYTMEVPYEVTEIEIFGEAVDKSTTITTTGNKIKEATTDNSFGVFGLSTGENVVKVNVRSSSGVTRTYIINIVRGKNNNNFLSDLTVKNGNANLNLNPYFDKKTESYTVNVSPDVTKVTVDGNVEVDSATVTGFGDYNLVAGNNNITINVTSESGLIRTYTINVIKEASSVNKLLDIIPSAGKLQPDFGYYETEYTLIVDQDVTSLSFEVEKEDEKSIVTGIDSQAVPVGTSIRTISVRAENGDIQEYIITVIRENSNTNLAELRVVGYDFKDENGAPLLFAADVLDYYITVPNDKNTLLDSEVIALPEDDLATVTKNGTLSLSTKNENIYEVLVTSRNGDESQVYRIHITRELSSDATLSNLIVNVGALTTEFNPDIDTYSWIVPKGTILNSESVTYVTSSDEASVEVTDNLQVIKDQSNIYLVTVTAEDGTIKVYTLNVSPEIDTDSSLSEITFNKGMLLPEFDPEVTEYSLIEYVDETDVTIGATPNSPYASITGGTGLVALASDEVRHDITVTAEDGSITVYTIYIRRSVLKDEGLNNLNLNGLDTYLTEEDEGFIDKKCINDKCILNPNFDRNTTDYKIKVPYEYTNLDVLYETMNVQQSVKFKINGNYYESYYLPVGTTNVEVEVYDGLLKHTKTYNLEIERALSNNTYLESLVITNGKEGAEKIMYELTPTFEKHIQEYMIYVDKDVDEVKLEGVPEDPTSKIRYNGYNYLEAGENDATITVSAGDYSTRTYIVHIVKYDTYNNYLKNITVSTGIFWDLSPKFKPTTFEYSTEVPFNSTTATVEAVPLDINTVISGIGEYPLVTGINTVTLTSTALGDGSVSVYTIKINKPASLNVNLSSLVVDEGELSPAFDKSTIRYNITVDSDVNKLTIHAIPEDSKATYMITGNNNLQAGTNIVNIIVMSENKSASKTYQLVVNKSKSHNNKLSELRVRDDETVYPLDPEYEADTLVYDVVVPYDVEKVYIEGTTASSVATMSGVREEYLDYGSNLKQVTVTSESGDIRIYNINIYREYNLYLKSLVNDYGDMTPVFSKEILEYTLDVPKDKNDITFIAFKESNRVEVTGTGTYELQPGPNEIDFVVTSPDDHSLTYKVIVNKAKDDNNYIKDLNVNGIIEPTFDKLTNEYIVHVRKEVESLDLSIELESEFASYEVIGNSNFKAINEENEVIIKVTAQNGDIREYKLKVFRRPDSFFSNRLLDLTVSHGDLTPDFNPDINNYALTVPNSVSELIVETTKEDEYATVTGDGKIKLELGRNLIDIVVTSRDGEENIYSLVVYRTGSSDATLKSLSVKDLSLQPLFNKLVNEYRVEITDEIDLLDITAIPTDPGAKVEIKNKLLDYGENTIEIKVTSADEKNVNTYRIIANKGLSKNNYLKELSVVDYKFDKTFIKTNNGPYIVTVGNTVNTIKVDAIPEVDSSYVTGDGVVKLETGENIVTVNVTSKSGDVRTYTIIVNKLASSDSTLKSILLSDGDLVPEFDSDTLIYDVLVPEELETITINGIPNDNLAKVSGNGSFNVIDKVTEFPIYVTAEDGTSRLYKVRVTRDIKSTSKLSNLIVQNGELNPHFDKLIFDYTILVPNEVESLDMIVIPEDKDSKYEIMGNKNFEVGTNKVVIRVTGKDGVDTTDYTLSVVRQKPASNYLKTLEVVGYSLVPKFDKEVLYYEVTVPIDVEQVKIRATTEDSSSTITGTGIKTLDFGDNLFYVGVESASGMVRTYQIKVNRTESSENYLLTLETDVGTLKPEFDKTVNNYDLVVPDKTTEVVFTGTSSENSKVIGLGTTSVSIGKNQKMITVTSQSGEVNTYNINIVRNASTNTRLESLVPSAGTFDYSNDIYDYEFDVDDNFNIISFTAIPEDSDATVTGTETRTLDYGSNEFKIIVTAEDGITTRTINLKVNRKRGLFKIIVEPSDVLISLDETATISYSLEPADTSFADVEWDTEDASIATVNNGVITGVGLGSTRIIVRSKIDSSIYQYVNVNVVNKRLINNVYTINRDMEGIDDYIIGLNQKTTYIDFLNTFENNPSTVFMYDLDGNEIKDEDTFIGTGFVVKLIIDDKEYDKIDVVVRGDLTGDGILNITDYNKLNSKLLKKTELTPVEMLAADTSADGVINITDYNRLNSFLLKKLDTLN